jgi:hypothetical protein
MAPSTMQPDDLAAIANATADVMEKRSVSGVHQISPEIAKAIAENADEPSSPTVPEKRRWWDRYNVAFSLLLTTGGILVTAAAMWGAFGSTVSAQTKRIDAVEQDAKSAATEATKAAVVQAEQTATNTAEHQALKTTATETKNTTAKIEEKVGKIEIDVALMKQSVDAQSRKLDQVLAKLK